MLRRAFDVAVASLGCVVFAPFMAVVSALVLVTDGRPLLFRQERVGRGRRRFTVLKIRTMRDGAVTAVGRYLRATGLDEIMQVANVLAGDMSIVGPRPLTPADVERLGLDGPAHDLRFSVSPGITGLAQLFAGRGRNHSRRLDRLQVAHSSLLLDLKVIGASVVVNLAGKRRARRLIDALRRRQRRALASSSTP